MADLFTLVGKIAIDAKDAETQIQSMIDKANELNTALGGTGGTGSTGTTSNSNPTAKKTTKSTNALFSAIDTAITVASGFAFKFAKDIDSTGTEMMMTMENAAASFSTKLGVSYEEGMAFAEELRTFAKDTPLGLSSVLLSADQLLSAGIPMENIVDMLTVIGNNINGDDSKMYRATKFVTDVKGYDQLNAQEKRQGVENGIYIDRLLEDYFFGGEGVTGEALKAGIEKLAKEVPELITSGDYDWSSSTDVMHFIDENKGFDFEDMWNALVYAQEYGNFANAMANKMNTYGGTQEKFSDSFAQYTEAIVGESGWGKLKKGVMQLLTNIMDSETERLYEEGLFGYKNILRSYESLYAEHEAQREYYGNMETDPAVLYSMLEPYLNNHDTESDAFDAWADYENYNDPEFIYDFLESMKQEVEAQSSGSGGAPDDWVMQNEEFKNTVQEWSSAFNVDEIKTAVAQGIAEGLAGVTITTGNVTLNDGTLVARILPRINRGLGNMAMRELRE